MVIFWRGQGYLVPIITFGCLLLSDWLTTVLFGDKDFYADHGWPKLTAFLVAAALVFGIDRLLDSGVKYDDEIASPTKDHDTFFFLPVRYWPLILCGLGILFFFI
jgi:hypothetical protein